MGTSEEGNGEKDEAEAEGSEKDKEKKELTVIKKASEEDDKQVDVMAPKKDTRSAAVDGWKFKVRGHPFVLNHYTYH